MGSVPEPVSIFRKFLRGQEESEELSSSEAGGPSKSKFPQRIWALRSAQVVEVTVFPLGERTKGKDFFSIRLHLEDESQPINLPRPTGSASFFELEVEEKEVPSFVRLTGRKIVFNYLTWDEKETTQNLSRENLELQEEILALRKRIRTLDNQLTFLVTSQSQEHKF